MADISELVERTLYTGAAATAGTTLAVAACGLMEEANPIAPINAVSHIAWDDQAARQTNLSWEYTGLGLALNAAAVTSWAGIYEACFGHNAKNNDVPGAILGGVLVSAAAYITDYYLVPKRLTPGFEKRLSNRSLFGIYATLAGSLAAGSLIQSARASHQA